MEILSQPQAPAPVIPTPIETVAKPKTPIFMKFIRIFLLILIIIGIGLLFTINLWVPKLVAKILAVENTSQAVNTSNTGHTSQNTPVATSAILIPPNSTLVISNGPYNLYILENDVGTTTGQFFVVNEKSQQKMLLGGLFKASSSDIKDYLAVAVSKLIVSQDGKYLTFDEGTSAERSYSVYNLETGKDVSDFCANGDPIFWENTIIYLACDTSGLNTSFESGTPNIEAANLINTATTTLVSASVAGGHFFYKLDGASGDQLNYESTALTEYEGEGGSTYWDFATSTSAQDKILNLSAALSSWL
jgi:hypothetical protein